MLRVSDFHAGYGNMPVLMGINMAIASGEIVAVMGRNGVGKTTLMRALMGLIKSKQGKIMLDGVDISYRPIHFRAKAGVGYVPQGRQIFPRLSVQDNLRVAAGPKRYDDIVTILAKFPTLEARLHSLGRSLSGGEQQILALARVLVTKPRMLLIDEPTEGIQPTIIDAIGDEIRRMNKEEGVTVLLTEQNVDFATELAGRVLLMHEGRIARELSPQELLKDKEIQAEYLGV